MRPYDVFIATFTGCPECGGRRIKMLFHSSIIQSMELDDDNNIKKRYVVDISHGYRVLCMDCNFPLWGDDTLKEEAMKRYSY